MAKRFSDAEVELSLKCFSRQEITKFNSQMTSVRYKFRSGRVFIEGKEDIKSRLGASPDMADCYNIFIWGYDKVPCSDADIVEYFEEENANSYNWETVL